MGVARRSLGATALIGAGIGASAVLLLCSCTVQTGRKPFEQGKDSYRWLDATGGFVLLDVPPPSLR